jgi:hypothetical protein
MRVIELKKSAAAEAVAIAKNKYMLHVNHRGCWIHSFRSAAAMEGGKR